MADKKYTKLPVIHQTPVIKNFFDTTVEQLFSKANVESMSAYVGRREEDLLDARDTYILQPTADRDKFSLEPAVSSIDQTTGKSTNIMFYEDYINVLKSYGVNTLNQNSIFDTEAYTFLPPISIDKFVNYQEYFWSPNGPTPVIVEGTDTNPINIEKDIVGKKSFTTPSGVELKSGMVVTFSGNYVIPNKFKNEKRFIVEGVGESIILHDKEQNFATVFSTEDYIPFDQTIIDSDDDLVATVPDGTTEFNSGGLAGVENYVSTAGQNNWPTSDYAFDQTDPDTGIALWGGYVAPLGTQLVYTVGGEGAYDIEPFDSDNTQENPDYIIMERGATDNNVWSRINFWHHKNNFLDVGDQLPPKGKRAVRPIIEFDRNIELYNFGTTGKFSVDMSTEGYLQSEVVGRPTGASIDSVTLQPGNTILLASDDASVSQHAYIINDDGAGNVALSKLADESSPAGLLDGDAGFIPYVAQKGDVITIKFGARYQGIEYYWSGTEWIAGQQKTKINTPIEFVMYDSNKVRLDNDALYPNSTFTGNNIFGYTPANANRTADPILGFPLEYKNFNNFSEISFTNHLDDYFESYVPFGGTSKSQIKGYIYYKKNNNDVTYDTAWRPLEDKLQQRVEDRYVISDSDFETARRLYHISAVPTNSDSDIAGLVEKSIRVYVNGIRTELFSYDSEQIAIKFSSFTFSRLDIVDIFTETKTGYFINAKTDGRYHVPGSWHSNLDNADILSISQPEYLEHFKNLMEFQEDAKGDSLGANNSADIKTELKYADKILQTDDDLRLSAFLFSNDKFNIKDSMDFVAEEYVKYKNRLKKEIVNFVNSNDYSTMSYGEMLELVIENVIAYNQGKNVFDDTFMIAFGDKYIEEKIIINNVLTKEYTCSHYLDLLKIDNTVYVYETDGTTPDKLLCADIDYAVSSSNGVVTITFTNGYTPTLGNTIKVRLYDANRESAQVPATPSALGMYPITYPEIVTDASFVSPIKMVVGHDGSKSVALDDVHDFILLEFEKRVYNATLQQFRNSDSLPDLNVTDIRPGRFRTTGRNRDEFYALLRSNFNNYITRNNVDFVKNEFYKEDNLWTWNYNAGTPKPAYWRGIFESCYDTERPHTHPWEMIGFTRKPTWWETTYGTDYSSTNVNLWADLEQGIIRQGNRENVTNSRYKENNPYRRIGLAYELPVNASGELIAPANIISTTATTKSINWASTTSGTSSADADTILDVDGLSVWEVGTVMNITTHNVMNHPVGNFPTSDNANTIEDKSYSYTIESFVGRVDPSSLGTNYANATSTSNTAIGLATNGALITNANSGIAHSDSTNFTYNNMFRNEVSRDTAGGAPDNNGIYGYIQPSPQAVGLDNWNTTAHSPIVGWAFDGFPIYGPYGYSDRANASSSIKRIESSYSLKTTARSTIGGLPTGEFVEDYEYNSATGDLDAYNGRHGITPEFPGGTYYYVATIDTDSKPAYPYTTGPSFASIPRTVSTNNNGTATTQDQSLATFTALSTLSTAYSVNTELTNKNWKFGDNAPVENAWRISEGYPFAVMQALLLAQPGKFASVFSDPRKPFRGLANSKQLLDRDTKRRIKTKLADIHGEVTASEQTVYTVGFTQFIHAFMKFQGLNTTAEFVKPYRSIISKLGHKFAGYIDKDTMTVFSDSYSSTGNSSSLILPQEDIEINVHVGPYSTTNDFTGVLITYTTDGKYKIDGYNSVKRFFEIEESNINGPQSEVSVGGEPVAFGNYSNSTNYQIGTVVKSGYNFYRAKEFAGAGSVVTDTSVWQRLPSLPMTGAAEATLYLTGTGTIKKVEYGTVFDTVDEVFDFLNSLGRKQEAMGYDFGEFNGDINDVNNWLYSGRQFLFWSIGKWAAGNTLSLSPLASGVKFTAPIGRVSKIIDVDQSQYSILDQEGRSIKTSECEIIRDTNKITINPPEGKQIYGVILYTNEIEHAMVLSNKTIFGDTIFDNVLSQRQRRIKIKGKRTANWNGTLTADGYIITDNGLKPNFDTLAGDMGKYNEIGHVPVEKQLYEASRRQYGYEERKYLREFELTQDDQYDFYSGMIRSKGTKNSIEVLLNSDKVLVPGSVAVYDEWALKAGDFGDIENYQTIDLKITESEITNERQLIQVAYPEDIVSKVNEVEVLDRTTKFYQRPFLEIEPPPADIPGSFEYGGGTTAKATVNIGTDGRISDVTVDEPGYGYTINPSVTVVAAQLFTANITTTFLKPYAVSTSNITVADLTSAGNILITDNFSSNVNTVIDLSSVTTVEDVANAINSTNDISANISATFTRTAGAGIEEFYLTIKGSDFTLAEQGAGTTLESTLNLPAKRYQPRQRYSFETANSTTFSDIIVSVDGATTTGNVVGSAGSHDWEFDEGSRTTIVTNSLLSGNVSQSFTFTPVSVSDGITTTNEIAADNLQIINGSYPHVDVEINGIKLPETSEEALYTITSNVSSGESTITFLDCGAIPGSPIQPNSTIEIIERGTIDLEDSYQGDLPGSSMNIKVFANDALAAKLTQIRTFEIYPDSKDDATILIDVDDPQRLTVRPSDMAEKGLWPMTSSVSYVGMVDSKYAPLPNSGYVSKYNVQYQAFDIYDFENLFDVTKITKTYKLPKVNDMVHFAKGEHEEFEVYKLTDTGANISYVEYDNTVGTSFLWADVKLSDIILDNNMMPATAGTFVTGEQYIIVTEGSTDFTLIGAANSIPGTTFTATGVGAGNGTASLSTDYDHTKWFDQVLALKGDNVISDSYKDLVSFDGNPIYVTEQAEVDHPVTRFISEEKVAEQSVEMGNIQYTIPAVNSILEIRPQLSGNIISAEPVALQHAYQFARATVPTTTDITIFRSVDAVPDMRVVNNQLTFTINNGHTTGVAIGHYLKFNDNSGSNLNGNIFQVANLTGAGDVQLYANTTVLGGMTNTVPKANISFINFGKNKTGNTSIDYDVQMYSPKHEFRTGTEIVFDVDNMGGSAGEVFTVKATTDDTFTVGSRLYGTNSSLNVITDSANVSLAKTTLKITAVPNSLSTMGHSNEEISDALINGITVRFKDSSGTELADASFAPKNIRAEKVLNKDLISDSVGKLGNISVPVQGTVESSVTSGTIVDVTTPAIVEPGMYLFHESIEEPVEVLSVNFDLDNEGSEPVKLIKSANATTNTLTLSSTSNIRVGDFITLTGVIDAEEDTVTVASISGRDITLSQGITSVTTVGITPEGEPYNILWDETQFDYYDITLADGRVINNNDTLKFRHKGDGQVANVTVKNTVTLSSNDTIEFAKAIREIVPGIPAEMVDLVVFDIEPDTYTGGNLDETNLSFTINEATKITTDADLSTLENLDYVKINKLSPELIIQKIRKVDTTTNSFVVLDTMLAPIEDEFTVATGVTADTSVSIVGTTNRLVIGMNVSGTGVPANTKVEAVSDNETDITLTNAVTLSAGDIIQTTMTMYEEATFMSANTVITTREDHSFAIDGSDKLIGKEITVNAFEPDYYNNTFTVVDIPTANTIVVDYPGFAHPYEIGGETYSSKFGYLMWGEDAGKLTGKDGFIPFLVADHLGDIKMNGADVVKGVYPWHSVEQYANDIRDTMYSKAGSVVKKGSMGIRIDFMNIKQAVAAYQAAGGKPGARPGAKAAPLPVGTKKTSTAKATPPVTAKAGPSAPPPEPAKAGKPQNQFTDQADVINTVRGQCGVTTDKEPTLTPQEIANSALLEGLTNLVDNILPHQQAMVQPQAQNYLNTKQMGYSLGGGQLTNDSITYGDGGSKWGTQQSVYNYSTGAWESVDVGTSWTRDGVTYTMKGDGTIEGDDGTIWVTSATRTQKGSMGALGDQYANYGKKYGGSDGLTFGGGSSTPLTGKIALFNDVALGETVQDRPGLSIEHADYNCAELITHTHNYELQSETCWLDANGKNPTGKQRQVWKCTTADQPHLGICDKKIDTRYVEGIQSCYSPYADAFKATWDKDVANEGTSATFTVTADNVVAGETVEVDATGSVNLANNISRDISGGLVTPFTMTFSVDGNGKGTATKTVTFVNDSTTEGQETLRFQLRATTNKNSNTGRPADTVAVGDTSLDPIPTYTLISADKTRVSENGERIQFIVEGKNLSPNASLTATMTGVQRSDFDSGGDLSNSMTLTFNMVYIGAAGIWRGVAEVMTKQDETTEGAETLTLTPAGADSNGASVGLTGSASIGTVSVVIDDTSLSPVPDFEEVDYYLYHLNGPTTETTSFHLAADTSINKTLNIFFNMYGAADRMDVYQGTTKGNKQRLVASTSTNPNCTTLTTAERNRFDNIKTNLSGEGTTGSVDMGGVTSGGGRKNVGKCFFNYRPGNGRWITVVTKRAVGGSNSSVFLWAADRFLIDRGQNPWYFEASNSSNGAGAPSGTGSSGGASNQGGGSNSGGNTHQRKNSNTNNQGCTSVQYNTVNSAKTGSTTHKVNQTGQNTAVNPVALAQFNGLTLPLLGFHIGMVGNGPGLGTKPNIRSAGQTTTVKRFDNQESFFKGSITASATNFNNTGNQPTGPLSGRPSFAAADGSFVPSTKSPIPDNSAFNPHSNPQKPKPRVMTISLLKKNSTGMYGPLIAGASQAALDIPMDEYCMGKKVKFCATNKWIDPGSNGPNGVATGHSIYSVRAGDSFWINSTQITLNGVTDTASMRAAIEQSSLGGTVDVTEVDDGSGGRCVEVRMRDNTPDPIILRNGCKGGELKEVLDYTVNNKKNYAYSESTTLAGTRTSTTNVSTDISADTDSNANTADVKVGSVSTTASGTDYITNTITAQQRLQRKVPSTITQGFNGSGYVFGDILRAVGGVAVSQQSNPAFSGGEGLGIYGISFAKGGFGYGKMNPATGEYENDGSTRIIVGGPGQSGYGFEFDERDIKVDPVTGALIGVSWTDGVTNYNGLPAIPTGNNNGTGLFGQGYVYNNPPSVTIIGKGRKAVGRVIFNSDAPSSAEEVAVFKVTRVDDDGAIVDLKILNRGLYQTFPGDLNSGVPLEYHIQKENSDSSGGGGLSFSPAAPGTVAPTNRNAGKGGRVFLTGRLIGDCTQKGTAIQDMGLEEGEQKGRNYEQSLVDYINDHSTKDPNGFPYFSASLDDEAGIPGIIITSEQGDGFDIEGSFPGMLEDMNLPVGAIIPEIPPIIDVVAGGPAWSGNRDKTGGPNGDGLDINGNAIASGTGPDANKSIRFKSTNPFGISSAIGDLVASGELYKYELRRLDGSSPINITATGVSAMHVNAYALQSQRIGNDLHANGAINVDVSNLSNVWIDDYQNTGKWAYLENNTVIRQQEKLVDTKFIRDVFTYDEVSAEKEFDVDLYDPFKGILPGFIGKEIDFKTERDPVVYDPRKVKYGKKDVGLRWWDTSSLRYTWYEQGAGAYGSLGYNNYERSQNWGEMFPGSKVVIYEWVESLTAPTTTSDYITEVHPNANGKPQTFYYFWQTDLTVISDASRVNFQKERSVAEITRLLQDLDSERVPYTGIISPDGMVVNTMGSLIRTDDSILSVNFKRKDTENAQKHSSWSLAGEGDRDGTIPDNLSVKLIDSLAGFNALDQAVPGSGLSASERYGSKFRPRQTMFKDIKKARKQMFVILNDIFKQIQMESTFLNWRDNLPTDYSYIERVNWYEQLRTDKTNNAVIYYDNTYKPLRKVTDTKQFGLLQNVLDKSIIQVQKNDSVSYTLYEYTKKTDTFKLIAMENETVRWVKSVYSSGQSLTLGKEVREILNVLYKHVFVNTYSVHWNRFFFEMLKYAYAEQGELDWAFKTTYLKIVKEETDLIPFKGFKIDNFDKAVEYFNEVKPYSSKIRNYSDIKKAPVEIMSGSTSDFDRPPFYDEAAKSVRILDSNNADDLVLLNTDKDYTGFSATPSKIRSMDQTIVFDRVKGAFYENTTGGAVQTIIADGTTSVFNLNFAVEDSDRLQIFVNGKKVDKTSTSGNATVTNYAVDVGNSFISFSNDANVNNAIGLPENGDKIEVKYIDGFDPTLETMNVSIAKNIVAVETASNNSIANTSLQWTAPERLWKFNPAVRTEVTNAFELAYGVGAGSNTAITTNISLVTDMVNSGNLTTALNLVKSKVHATFQGEELDGNIFTDVVPGTHPTTHYTDTRGFDTFGWDDGLFDREVEVNNFIGVFDEDTQGNVNYRVDDQTVYGFDSVTFLKSQYGPDRPEELVVVQPLETLVMDVTTKGNVQISQDSTDVRFMIFMDIFGQTEYYRRNVTPLTTVTTALEIWDNEITFADVSKLPRATKQDRAVIWINGERIEYEQVNSLTNTITGIIRGTKGTTPNTNIPAGAHVYNGEETENIRLRDANGLLVRDPEDFTWIKPVEIFDDTIPFDDDWDGNGSLTVTNANVNYANVTYDGDSGNITYGFDSSWDDAGSFKPTSNDVENYTLPSFDIDEVNGWDSGDKEKKEAGSLTDKGTVLKSNVSIIDFLHNFE